MAGLSSALPTLINGGLGVANLNQKSQDSSASNRLAQEQLAYQREQDAAKRAAEQAAREYNAQLQQQETQRAWEREDRLRQEELARQAAATEAAKQEAEAQRKQAMEIFTGSQSNTYQQLLARQNEELSAAQAAADTQLQQIATAAQTAETQRQEALKKTLASTRASLGANGVSVADGSGRAVLLGRQAETDSATQAAAAADQLRRQAIQADIDNRRRVNLLAQAELAEKQRMEYINKFYS